MTPRKPTKKSQAASVRKSSSIVKKSPTKPRVTHSLPLLAQEKTSAAMSLSENMKNPKMLIGLGVVILLAGLLYFFRSWFVVAAVNGHPISRMAFNHALEQQDGKTILNSLITQSLIEQEAERKHVTVSQAEIDSSTKQIDQQLASQGQTLDQALTARGMNKSDFITQLKLQKMVEKLLGNSTAVTDKEVQDYIEQHQDQLDATQSADQQKAQVKAQLEQEKLSTKAQELIANLQKQAHITYFINL